jgi:hypothetical protein
MATFYSGKAGIAERQRARPVDRIVPDVNRLADKPPVDQGVA